MTRFVALLRGVNVGGSRTLSMQQLRQVFESQGLSEVSTYIQSGNVVFGCDRLVSSLELSSALAGHLGMEIDVILRTGAQLQRIVDGNPFPTADPRELHVGYMLTRPDPASLENLDLEQFPPEAAVVRDTEIYFHLPDGIGRAKLPTYLNRRFAVPTTICNWNTTIKLLELVHRR